MAKTTKTKNSKSSRRAAGRNQRRPNSLLFGGGAIAILIIGLVVYFSVQRSIPVSGEQRFPTQGNAHLATGQVNSFAYNSTPPTSGPHYGSLAQWGIHTTPVPYEFLVHNLEDGGVVIFYQCAEDCPDVRESLTAIVEPYERSNQRVVLVPNDPEWTDGIARHAEMDTLIAVAAWNRLLTLEHVDEERIQAFIRKYEGIDHHRG